MQKLNFVFFFLTVGSLNDLGFYYSKGTNFRISPRVSEVLSDLKSCTVYSGRTRPEPTTTKSPEDYPAQRCVREGKLIRLDNIKDVLSDERIRRCENMYDKRMVFTKRKRVSRGGIVSTIKKSSESNSQSRRTLGLFSFQH